MIAKIKTWIAAVAALSLFAIPMALPAVAYAQGSDQIQGPLCTGADQLTFDTTAGGCNISSDPNGKLTAIIQTIINVISVVVGVVAVIMIIFGGLRYITSGGDSSNVSTAKNTILYAIIGLVVVALAQFIVRFVLQRTITGGQ